MRINRRELKQQARTAMDNARPRPYWVCLAYMVILTLLEILSMSLSGSIEAYRQMFMSARMGVVAYVEPTPVGGMMGWILDVALQIMTAFDGFGVFFRAVWIQLLPSLLIGLWSMLYAFPAAMLVVMTRQSWWMIALLPLLAPAVMASYSYRLAAYVMLDRPELGGFQCVAVSRDMMRGHRWELFKLDMSFIGWGLLCAIPIVGLFLAIWLYVYMQVTEAGYYETLARQTMPGGMPPEPPPV